MRIYKAYLDNDFNVLSFEEPKEKETICNYSKKELFDVDLSILKDYIELNGYITTYKKLDSEDDFVMYLNTEHSFSTIWDNDTAIFVLKQIRRKELDEMWDNIEKEQGIKPDTFKGYIHTYPSIQGINEFKVGEQIHLKHIVPNGLWLSDKEYIADIDRHTGLLKAKKIGRAIVSYVADTGFGLATVFHKIQVV